MPDVLNISATVASRRPRGHLDPDDEALRIERLPVSPDLSDLARHVWIGRWDVPDGQVRRHRVLPYPGCNLVVTSDEAALYGPASRVFTRELRGRSWVLGVLLQPAATAVLASTRPRALVDGHEPLPGGPWTVVRAHMAGDAASVACSLVEEWLRPHAERIDATGRLVNEICQVAESDDSVLTVDDLAARLGMAVRTLNRALSERVGVTAKWLIDRRRLRQAAHVLREHPDTSLADVAAALGFADQAHFTRRYSAIIGESPGTYRRRAGRRRSGG
ncbi:AraC family transcriptional regulator [Thermasporomyces composti]|uniref:AraC family transcriptional regulator n=1 Tax=Thermasporomyces composti TaxID=696763 RepID=A0A3D9V1K0_THECX|nr:AraC family transcriptional regulator [Thermasporomyces composti]